MKNVWKVFVPMAVAGALFAAACGSSGEAEPSTSTTEDTSSQSSVEEPATGDTEADAGQKDADAAPMKVTLAVPPVADSLSIYVAIEDGIFADHGLDVELVPAANGAATLNALVAQSTDLALVSYPSIIQAHAAGMPVTIAAPAIDGTKDYMGCVYVPDSSPIAEPQDMIGKKMATPSLGSVGDIFFRGVLLDLGLDPSKVDYIEIPQANMAGLLESGDVDAAFITEPALSSASKALDLRPLACQEGPQGLFATSDAFEEANPDAVKAFRESVVAGMKVIESDPHTVAGKYLPIFSQMDRATAEAMHLPRYVQEYEPEKVQGVIDLMVREGLLESGFDAGELYNDLS